MVSQAALDGIKDNGLSWKTELRIKKFIPNDIPNVDIVPKNCLASILLRLSGLKDKLPEEFYLLAEEWEDDESISKQDLMDFLNELYDLADYYRILIT